MRYNFLRIKAINDKILWIIKVMCDCRDQNANKNMKLQIWSFGSETSNIEFHLKFLFGEQKLHIWNYKVSFGKALSQQFFL